MDDDEQYLHTAIATTTKPNTANLIALTPRLTLSKGFRSPSKRYSQEGRLAKEMTRRTVPQA